MITRGKILRIVFAPLVWVVAITGCEASGPAANETVRVCYISFSAMTYSAIDRESFPKKCTDLGAMKLADEPMRGLFEQIRQGVPAKSFDDDVVRLSIHMPNGTHVYVNQDGEVIYGAKFIKLPAQYIAKLERELDKLQERIFES